MILIMCHLEERPKRTPETIKWADVIVIPSEL